MPTTIIALLAAAAPQAVAAAPASGLVTPYLAEYFAAGQPNTAYDMLGRLPGFSFDGGDSVRGFGGAAGNVLVDGERPSSKSDSLDAIIRRIPASQVERIELIRAGAPGVDMQGKTVLANVVRKQTAAMTGVVQVQNRFIYDGRQGPGMRLEATRRVGPRLLEASLVVSGYADDGAGDGFNTVTYADGRVARKYVRTEGDGTQSTLTGAYETPGLGGKLRLNGFFTNDRYLGDEVIEPRDGSPDGITREHQTRNQGEAGLRYSRALGPKADLETVAVQQLKNVKYTQRYEEGADDELFSNDKTSGESVVRGVLRLRPRTGLAIETGAEGAYNFLDSETRYLQGGAPVAIPAADVLVKELRGEAFANATWSFGPKLSLLTGAKFEASDISSERDVELEKTLTFFKPRAVLTWSPNPQNQLRLRVEREVGQLNFGDFTASSSLSQGQVQAGNPDLNPEQAWVVEAAFEHRFWTNGSVVLTARHAELTDAIDRAPVFQPGGGVFDAPANIGDGTKDQIAANLTLPLAKLGIKGAQLKFEGTWTQSKVTDPTTGQERQLSGKHPVDWEAYFTQDLPQWKINWGAEVYGGWRERYYRFNEVQTYKLSTFAVLYAEYRPRKDLGIRLDIQNVTERGFGRIREIYSGVRGRDPLNRTDVRKLEFGRMYQIRVRKTFG